MKKKSSKKSILDLIDEDMKTTKVYANFILMSHDKKKLLILHRANYMKNFGGCWGFPGGTVDKNDKSPMHGAIRELAEETGIVLTANEIQSIKKYESIKNEDGSLSEYYMTCCEREDIADYNIKLSGEHSTYEWYNQSSKRKHSKWMPDVFKMIQKLLNFQVGV